MTLVSLDVESLYLSIPQALGINMVLQRVLPTTPSTAGYNIYKNFVRDLPSETMSFDSIMTFYKQIKGVAMGTKCAPPFANLFLESLEEQALDTWTGSHPLLWLRFIDDVLMLCDEQLAQFVQHLKQPDAGHEGRNTESSESNLRCGNLHYHRITAPQSLPTTWISQKSTPICSRDRLLQRPTLLLGATS